MKKERLVMEDYVAIALDMGCIDAKLISGRDLVIDPRTYLKCQWGCPQGLGTQNCPKDALKPWEAEAVIGKYEKVLLLHSDDKSLLSRVAYDIERRAFLDGHYFAFALCSCNLCENCPTREGRPCPTPDKIRPAEHLLGVNVFETVRRLGLPIQVLRSEDEKPNHYCFVLIE